MFKLSSVTYKDILEIDELKIPAQQITCIIGKSGSGKTTLLKLLNNMLTIDQGSLQYRDREITDYDPLKLRREVVMLPQNPVMFSTTIKDNFTKTLNYTEQQLKDEAEYRKLLTEVNLDLPLSTDTDQLSGGEKQRLALARLLLLKPEIMLLDEPSSALDEETEEFIIEMVVDYIKSQQSTLVMITHSRELAQKFGDLIITLRQGQVSSIAEEAG
ncbi:MAG: ABC transporter ATP-binding protein [Bacillota bacterium]